MTSAPAGILHSQRPFLPEGSNLILHLLRGEVLIVMDGNSHTMQIITFSSGLGKTFV